MFNTHLPNTYQYLIFLKPLDAITNRSSVDGTTVSSSLSDSDLNKAKSTATGKDVAFVFITSDSGEAYITVEGNAGDRNDLFAWHGGVSNTQPSFIGDGIDLTKLNLSAL